MLCADCRGDDLPQVLLTDPLSVMRLLRLKTLRSIRINDRVFAEFTALGVVDIRSSGKKLSGPRDSAGGSG